MLLYTLLPTCFRPKHFKKSSKLNGETNIERSLPTLIEGISSFANSSSIDALVKSHVMGFRAFRVVVRHSRKRVRNWGALESGLRQSHTIQREGKSNTQPTYRAMVTFKNKQFVILNHLAENTYPSAAPSSLIDIILGYRQNSTDAPYTVVSRGIPVPPAGVVLKDISDHRPYIVR